MVGIEPKILSIGDPHGRTSWKIACFGSYERYEEWRRMCDAGEEIDLTQYPMFMYWCIIFIGDYVDSFDIEPIDIKRNLEDILHLKKMYPDKIVLLLGNHDVAYIKNKPCSGFIPAMIYDYQSLFRTIIEGEPAFQIAYQYKDWLWTHAGITQGFYQTSMSNPAKEDSRFKDLFDECKTVAEKLNLMYLVGLESISSVGYKRGGINGVPGPLWADKTELYSKPAFGLNQIVGHTAIDQMKGYSFKAGRYTNQPSSIYFIDCLGTSKEVMSVDFNFEEPKVEYLILNEDK